MLSPEELIKKAKEDFKKLQNGKIKPKNPVAKLSMKEIARLNSLEAQERREKEKHSFDPSVMNMIFYG